MRPVVVAEIGINHNGDVELAKSIIALSKNIGADFVKFQKRDIDLVYTKEYLDKPRVSKWGTTTREQKEGLEFGKKEYDIIDAYCNEIGISWFASPWDINSVEFLTHYNVPYMKIASACITDMDLLDAVVETKIPIIMSTGMSTTEEVMKALDRIKSGGGTVEYLLHCVSSYPTPDNEMNMLGLRAMIETYEPQIKVGFSNHSPKIIYTVQAAIMGAKMLEFHVTLDRNFQGTDHQASIGPVGFDRIMSHLQSIESGWGNEVWGKVQPSEIPVKSKLRRIQ